MCSNRRRPFFLRRRTVRGVGVRVVVRFPGRKKCPGKTRAWEGNLLPGRLSDGETTFARSRVQVVPGEDGAAGRHDVRSGDGRRQGGGRAAGVRLLERSVLPPARRLRAVRLRVPEGRQHRRVRPQERAAHAHPVRDTGAAQRLRVAPQGQIHARESAKSDRVRSGGTIVFARLVAGGWMGVGVLFFVFFQTARMRPVRRGPGRDLTAAPITKCRVGGIDKIKRPLFYFTAIEKRTDQTRFF